nr:tigger transposable element-derived protein 6-like [Dermacentor andersoni]
MTRDIFGKWLADFDKEMVRKKLKVLMLLDNCSAHHVNAHLSTVEVLLLPPNTTAKLQPMDQGVIANFKVHYRRRVIERLLIDVHAADNVAGMKVPLVKAIFFASGAWRDVKHLTIAHCFEKAGFSRSSSTEAAPAGDEATAIDVAATTDAAAATDFTTEEAAESVMEETLVDSASDSECDDASCAPKPVTSAAAIAAVDTLRTYLRSPEFDQIIGSQLDAVADEIAHAAATNAAASSATVHTPAGSNCTHARDGPSQPSPSYQPRTLSPRRRGTSAGLLST